MSEDKRLSVEKGDYASGPCYPELVLLLATGVAHVLIELFSDGLKGVSSDLNRPQYIFNIVAVCVWLAYFAWRFTTVKGLAKDWGFGLKGFISSFSRCILFLILPGALLLGIYGRIMGNWPLPGSFWLVMMLYPVWAVPQEFALQVLVRRNLTSLVSSKLIRAVVSSALFSLAHFPDFKLMPLTFVVGVPLTLVYEKHRNLWSIGITHAVLGSLAYYLVLGADTGGEFLNLLQ